MEKYDERIKYLTEKVNDITKTTTIPEVENKNFFNNIIPKNININKNYIIVGTVPLVILIILLIFKPKFVMVKNENNEEKLNLRLIIILTIISAILSIGVNYVYFYKK